MFRYNQSFSNDEQSVCGVAADDEEKKQAPGSSQHPAYECPDCGITLHLPAIEVLRHRRSHQQAKSSTTE